LICLAQEHGSVKLSTYLAHYPNGDAINIKTNAAHQKGMPQNSPMAMALLEPSSITNNCYIALTRPMWHSKMVYPTNFAISTPLFV